MSTVGLVEKIAPELCGDTRIPFALDLAVGRLDPACFGDQIGNALAMWAAHFVTKQERAKQANAKTGGIAAGASGIVSSMRAGDLSIAWAQVQNSTQNHRDKWLESTDYGLMYIGLRDSLACSSPFVITLC